MAFPAHKKPTRGSPPERQDEEETKDSVLRTSKEAKCWGVPRGVAPPPHDPQPEHSLEEHMTTCEEDLRREAERRAQEMLTSGEDINLANITYVLET